MKSTLFLSSLARWGWLRGTAVWLLGAFILVMGLSACSTQADPIPTTTPVPATAPDTTPVEADDSPDVPAAAQVTTGFNISGWV
ncbi:MAG: hypothetical protein ACE5FD_03990 [Anaerolineae bacterium]